MARRRFTATVDAHSAARARLTERATVAVTAEVARFTGWYDHDAITRMVGDLVRIVEAAQVGVARATDAFLARVTTDLVAATVRPVGAVDVTGLRLGTTHAGAYGRLADQYRFGASEGFGDAVLDRVVARARAMVRTDIQLAVRAQVARFIAASPAAVVGYRRLLRPEASSEGACGLCVAASDRVYGRGDLMPLHTGCECGVAPMTATHDPGRSLNADELDEVYGQAGSTARDDLIKTRFRVEEHGELGPVLVHADHHHRGPAAAA